MSLKTKKLPWAEPLNLAQKIAYNYVDEDWIFLYSGLNEQIKNSYSFIALFPNKKIITNNLDDAQKEITKNPSERWFGYISYEYKNQIEHLPKTKKSLINLPQIYLANFHVILEFNHDKKSLKAHFTNAGHLTEILKYTQKKPTKKKIKVSNFSSNFSSKEYLHTIEESKKLIARGDIYQVNLTRKFFGNLNLSKQYDFFTLFTKLTAASPANYSSFLRIADNFIISSSPELFLSIKNDQIISRPIKGTAKRDSNLKQDKKNRENLKNSEKERAENLMIVDLVRNDLARICKAGGVKVKNLFKVNSYKTLHHLSSEIIGKIDKKFNIIDTFKSCFPPGSMTGAPKIKAMEIISQKEKLDRGIYSGAIGYLSDNEANFSVVIRTLICQQNNDKTNFEFQVGGAITFDSDANQELQETLTKAQGIAKILNLENKKFNF